jgi:hypothetical protein
MKNAWIVACTLLFVSVTGFAQARSAAPLESAALAVILDQPVVTGSCATQQSGVLFAAKHPGRGLEKSICSATAQCLPGTVSCSGNSTCSAVDRNCSIGERGHVTCDGVTTSCPVCCATVCCQCDQTNDCMACCRCGGGTVRRCSEECFGGF